MGGAAEDAERGEEAIEAAGAGEGEGEFAGGVGGEGGGAIEIFSDSGGGEEVLAGEVADADAEVEGAAVALEDAAGVGPAGFATAGDWATSRGSSTAAVWVRQREGIMRAPGFNNWRRAALRMTAAPSQPPMTPRSSETQRSTGSGSWTVAESLWMRVTRPELGRD